MREVRYACVTDAGCCKHINEDRWVALPDRGLFVVADGMANATAPEEAVGQLPELLEPVLASALPLDDPFVAEEVTRRVNRLNLIIHDVMVKSREFGLGTTLVLLLVRDGQVLVAHLGDSRAYLCRAGRLEPLTRDHSYAEMLADMGAISDEQAREAPDGGGPTQFLGLSCDVEPDLRTLDLLPGDRILLCTDGLTGMVPDVAIEELLSRPAPPDELCRRLVDAAIDAGGTDNVTALVVEAG